METIKLKEIVNKREIKIGDFVRSYDFQRSEKEVLDGCYMFGKVKDIGKFNGLNYNAYKISVIYIISENKKRRTNSIEYIYPPVNGTIQTFSDYKTNGVELVELKNEMKVNYEYV